MSEGKQNGRKAVYTIVERNQAKPRWLRIGIGFTNRDGSLNVILDALPLNGELHIRDFPSPDAEAGAEPAIPPEAHPAEERPARRQARQQTAA